ncbi:PTS sugar transporter subunit IIA [Brevibacillus sp. SIMBA_040]|uniref:PTS sugar transporter subunit IIA n=1 Tax=unclassified Brevibacillus TaxID=2684853 RepID=UPI0039783630
MRKYIVASHGIFSKGIMDSVGMIVGKFENVDCISVVQGDSPEIINGKIEELLQSKGEKNEVIVLTDVFGGSVTNSFFPYIKTHNIHVITGVNLPLALEILIADEQKELQTVIDEAIVRGREGMKYLNPMANL